MTEGVSHELEVPGQQLQATMVGQVLGQEDWSGRDQVRVRDVVQEGVALEVVDDVLRNSLASALVVLPERVVFVDHVWVDALLAIPETCLQPSRTCRPRLGLACAPGARECGDLVVAEALLGAILQAHPPRAGCTDHGAGTAVLRHGATPDPHDAPLLPPPHGAAGAGVDGAGMPGAVGVGGHSVGPRGALGRGKGRGRRRRVRREIGGGAAAVLRTSEARRRVVVPFVLVPELLESDSTDPQVAHGNHDRGARHH
mmetsp:Transcript_87036/g.245516  ORF Transcript_87036/g.245516 Transcript_87036/m.245516 type:complete len:256 (+) Transcript_87036:355-1122(+)